MPTIEMCESELQKVQSECIQLVDYLKWIILAVYFGKWQRKPVSVAVSFVDPWSETILVLPESMYRLQIQIVI